MFDRIRPRVLRSEPGLDDGAKTCWWGGSVPGRAQRIARTLLLLTLLFSILADGSARAQETSTSEAGTVVGTTGLNIRACPRVDCETKGLAQLNDPVTVTGPAENGYLPVVVRGVSGWAWQLYIATESRGTPYLYRGTAGCNRVALIFNIGIGYELQTQALRWLKEQNVPATIFPMGWWALAYPDDMREMAMLGFPIGSHGDARLNLTGYSDSEVEKDVKDSAIHIRQVIGSDPVPYFTPYAADMDERVRSIVARAGYLPVGWDVPADDWDVGITPEYVYDRVVPNVVDGSIVEFHLDGPSSAQSTAVAIPWIVSDLRKQGFRFVTIQEMAQPCGAATPVPSTPVSATAAQAATPAAAATPGR